MENVLEQFVDEGRHFEAAGDLDGDSSSRGETEEDINVVEPSSKKNRKLNQHGE